MTIALVMMFKNEEDIIFDNISWHYHLGFRNFVLINNGSTDKSMEEVKRASFISPVVIHDPDPAYWQDRRTNSASAFAQEHFSAKWVFALDADEFLDTGGKDIRELCGAANPSHVKIPSFSYLPTEKDPCGVEKTVRRMAYRRSQPDSFKSVLYAPLGGSFTQGNHEILDHSSRLGVLGPLWLRHYSVRSLSHFIRKARQGAAAYVGTNYPPAIGATWKKWDGLSDTALRTAYFKDYFSNACDLVFDPLPTVSADQRSSPCGESGAFAVAQGEAYPDPETGDSLPDSSRAFATQGYSQ